MDTNETRDTVVHLNGAAILTHKNNLVETNTAKLYLNTKASDICFIFGYERVYAHKAILAAGSDVFDAMFFGQLKENAEIEIVDAWVAAFREFLQFFYRSEMQLTTEHLGEVVILCRKYQVDDALKACEDRIKESFDMHFYVSFVV